MLTYADVSPNGNDADLSVDVTEVEYRKKKTGQSCGNSEGQRVCVRVLE